MPTYFPRQTIDWRAVEEPAVFRRLSVSLVEMALLTGVVLRIIRALTFGGGRANWLLFGASMLVAILLLVGMTTAHLANFSLRKWLWRRVSCSSRCGASRKARHAPTSTTGRAWRFAFSSSAS
jgi:hypothetical protein